MMRTISSYIAAAAVLLSAIAKIMAGEAPDWTEIMLAIGVFTAAFGFQKKKPT